MYDNGLKDTFRIISLNDFCVRCVKYLICSFSLYPEMQQSNPSPVQHATGILDTEDDMDDPVFDELLANIGSSLAEHTAVVLPDTFDLEEQINELSYTVPLLNNSLW